MPEPALWTSAVLPWLAVVAVACGAVLAYRANQIGVLVGLLFAASSFSRITAPLGPYAVRLEQPALAVLIGLVVLRERDSLRRIVTGYPWILAAAAVYLGANLISSAVYAARPGDSLRIAGWLGLSMAGGLAVAALVVRAPRAAQALPGWIVGAASIQVGVGLMAVVSEALLHTTWGVQASDVVLGKIYGVSWEANVLATNLAMALAFLIVPGSGLSVGPRHRVAATLWLGFGLGLSYSRGGAVGLLVAALLAGVLVARRARTEPLPAVRRFAAPVLRLGAVALAAAFLTAGGLDALAGRGVGWIVVNPPGAQSTPASETPGMTPGTASPSPTEPAGTPTLPPHVGTGDTIAVRLNNIRIALAEMPRSPLVGLGTDSYPQRHIEPSCSCPAAISNLMVGALYDSGILGFLGLAGVLAGVLYLAWSGGLWAYLVSLLAMVIAYQATDAFRFASNWILMGAVLGIVVHRQGLPKDARLQEPGWR